MTEKIYDLIVIGSGVVGLSAGMYAGRLNMKVAVIGKERGGTITKTHVVENYPGIKTATGIELANMFWEHMKEYPVDVFNGEVLEIKKEKSLFVLKTKKQEIKSKTILFATGSEWRKLNVDGEEEFMNKGVHYCALCDGFFYKNKIVSIVGGGDSAAKEALFLAEHASKVYMLIRSKLRAEPINQSLVLKNKKIEVHEGVQIKKINGDDSGVTSITLDNEINGSKELKLEGVFVDIGHDPLSQLAENLGVKINKKKEIVIDKDSQTNVAGVYAAGDVTDTRFKQAITGVGEAVKAVYCAYEFVNNGEEIQTV